MSLSLSSLPKRACGNAAAAALIFVGAFAASVEAASGHDAEKVDGQINRTRISTVFAKAVPQGNKPQYVIPIGHIPPDESGFVFAGKGGFSAKCAGSAGFEPIPPADGPTTSMMSIVVLDHNYMEVQRASLGETLRLNGEAWIYFSFSSELKEVPCWEGQGLDVFVVTFKPK